MRIFCCFTPAHEVLFRTVFLPSVPEGFELRATEIPLAGPGDFLSPEFLVCIRKKIDLVVRSIGENPGKLIVWSDVDIQFFKLVPQDLEVAIEASGKDILFQRESPRMTDVNTGFFVCRCGPTVMEFFSKVHEQLGRHPGDNEQMVVNRLLEGREGAIESGEPRTQSPEREAKITWGYLPKSFYARTHGWPPPRQLAIYHANYTKGNDGIGQKLSQFQEMEGIHRGGMVAWIWSIVRRLPSRLGLARRH